KDVASWNVTLAAGGADVNDTVVNLGRRGEPVAERNRSRDIGIALFDDVQDDTRLTIRAKSLDRLPGLGVEREKERSGSGLDNTAGITDTALTKDVAGLRVTAEQLGDV